MTVTDDSRTDTPRPGTTHPHLARERALKVLFAADVRGVDARLLLDEVETHPADLELLDELEPDEDQVAGDDELQLELTRRRRLPVDDYTRLLVDGVASRRPAIDAVLGEVADRWPVHRMPAVDRNLLRLAVYELAEQDTPHAVVIDEAVSLAIAFAGEKARSFVNGVLETVRQQVVAGEVELTVAAPPTTSEGTTDEDDTDVQADVDAPEEAARATDEARTSGDVEDADEVDEAAQQAYDLALDLLDAQGPLDDWDDSAPDTDTDVEDDGASWDEADEELWDALDAENAAEDLGLADDDELRDEDDALW